MRPISEQYTIDSQTAKRIFRPSFHPNMGLSACESIHFVDFTAPPSGWPAVAGILSVPWTVGAGAALLSFQGKQPWV